MYFGNISSNNELHNQTSLPIILRENRAVETESPTTNPALNELDSSVFLFVIWIAFWSIISWGLVKVIQKLVTVKVSGLSILPVSQIPCRHCRFFAKKNQYLRCAVRPFTVLTREAIHCSDYCGKHESYSQAKYTREVKHGS